MFRFKCANVQIDGQSCAFEPCDRAKKKTKLFFGAAFDCHEWNVSRDKYEMQSENWERETA